jgi:hypothetical protein
VQPANTVAYVVDKPMTDSVNTRIYSATITVVDLFGIPVGGASAQITLANGTTVNEQSRSDGTIPIDMIPLGSFHAAVSSYGLSTSIEGDASSQTQYQARVSLSAPVLIVIIIVIISVAAASSALYLRRSKRRSAPEAPKVEPTTDTEQSSLPQY